MRSLARSIGSLTTVVVALSTPSAAAAAPPQNDNYLASTPISSPGFGSGYSDAIDTTDATTQTDLFSPTRDGLAFSGGGLEPTTCGPIAFGRTAWWDFVPAADGELEIQAEATFDVVVAVYEWNTRTSRITRRITCRDGDPTFGENVVLPGLRKGRNYTVQIGGVNGAGGRMGLALYFTRAAPTLRITSARLRVASALRDRYPDRFRGRSRFTRSCYRLSAHKVGCRVSWRKGAYRYSGIVWFRNDVSDPPAVEWTDARLTRKRVQSKRRPAPAPTPPPSRTCDPNYSGCLDPDAYDYDCAGGSGDGPRYTGPIRVIGADHFDLDRDGDGIACDDS